MDEMQFKGAASDNFVESNSFGLAAAATRWLIPGCYNLSLRLYL